MTEPSPRTTSTSAMSRRYGTLVVAALSIIVLTCVAFLVPVPYVTMKPGPAFNTLGNFDGKPMFTFGKGIKTFPTTGSLDFTTVSVTRADSHVPLAEAVRSYFDPEIAVVPKSLIYPDHQDEKQSTNESAAQLAGSKDTSSAAALTAAGYKVTSLPAIQAVLKDGASAGKLMAGDVIDKVDGIKPANAEGVVKAIGAHKPGDTVEVTVTRSGVQHTVSLVTKPDAKDKKIPRIGIALGAKFVFPIKITNNVGNEIGGPSAGTMFALAIYDKLTPGALTAGKQIAGTGEITGDGVVQPIGGVRQKMAGAQDAGAEIFLVPTANCAEAAKGTDFGLKLVRITTLKSAITALEKLAKDPKAKVASCS
ncbi:MAG: S16 family serine protease [Aeromicrobium sp.]